MPDGFEILDESDTVKAYGHFNCITYLYKPLGLSLPSNDDFKSLLVSLSTRLTDRYLITAVIQCDRNPRYCGSGSKSRWYNIVKPFVWDRNKGAGSVVGEQLMMTR